jgi:predicted metal-binding membrane protein
MIATRFKGTFTSKFRPSATIASLTLAIVAAWALAFWAEQSGVAATLHHDALYRAARPLWASGLLLLLTWQVMTAAMMLPSSLGLVRGFVTVSRGAPRREVALGLFLLAYFSVWTAFAFLAFWGDMGLHRIVDLWPALIGHPQIIAATLGAAAIYQLTPLKDACLRSCRHPGLYLMGHYQRGPLGGWRLGFGHALFCVGCCWALMLIMFAVGVAHLAWMGILALVTLVEKTAPWGGRLVWPIGAALAALALIELLRPGAVPGL